MNVASKPARRPATESQTSSPEASPQLTFTAAEIAQHVAGKIDGDGSVVLAGFAPADAAGEGDLTFAENEAYFARAEQSAASAVLVADDFTSKSKTLIRVPDARLAFAKVLPLFFPEPPFAPGIDSSAFIHGTADVHPTAHIGPFCVLRERVKIGARVVLEGGNHIGAASEIGEDSRLFPNVTLYPRSVVGARVRIHAGSVIGSDGFGYVFDKSRPEAPHRKVPQVGKVIIHDDVEIGANVTIDRGALGSTVIGRGSKIDNLVQIAHNVVIGENCIVVAQVGIAGSTKLGKSVTLAGQVGLAGHLKIGDQVAIGAQSGVMHDIPDGEKWLGSPAGPIANTKRQWIAVQKLPELLQRVKALEKQLKKKS
ncbi:MAG TPA: UDP-3-O-(3-hydroxymyristoyl)glucosamine N-acyltransferase [Candidatus Binatia bacterium]|nr:UDP-3-O-(3-hydroxymyristoyl)glucosamine N-acyltransferase [Candidatus Binatia bacterium]